ncbi:Prolyl endopeptidase [Strongyloides ratti]|uniref:Prolyl endopeptidase n=1 Tax=Strongyloides ratti TaxID=34506 RepID=A0A090L6P9_STRRB|nr:Prolyl endopeptidase [Strongyloides ratti]CEF63773.1 Prolyl endopeptidase [Strongyloides ratti]
MLYKLIYFNFITLLLLIPSVYLKLSKSDPGENTFYEEELENRHEISENEKEGMVDQKIYKKMGEYDVVVVQHYYHYNVDQYRNISGHVDYDLKKKPYKPKSHGGRIYYSIHHHYYYWLVDCQPPHNCKPPYCKPPPCKPHPPCTTLPPPTCEPCPPPTTCEPLETTSRVITPFTTPTNKPTPNGTTSRRTTPRKTTPRKTTPRRTTPKKTTPTEKPTPEETTPIKTTTPEEPTPEVTTPRRTTSRRTTPRRTTPRRTTPKKTTPTEKPTPEETTPIKTTTPEEPTPERTTSRKTTPRRTTPRKTTPRKTTPRKTTPRKTTPRKTTPPEESTPEVTTPRRTTSRRTTPRRTTPRRTTPRKTTPPEEPTPEVTTPRKTTPRKTTPKRTTPTEKPTPEGTTPIKTTPTKKPTTTQKKTTTKKTTPNETTKKTTPSTTTTSFNNCEEIRDFYLGRYESTIVVNVTKYPSPERCEECYKETFDHKVYNRYKYFENLTDERTVKFIDKLNEMSESYLKKSTIRNYLKQKLTTFSTFTKYNSYRKYGEYYYYTVQSSLKNHFVLKRSLEYDGKGETFFDVNLMDPSGRTSLVDYMFSSNNKYMAYLLSVDRKYFNTIRFKYTSGEDMEDVLENVILSKMAFAYDGYGFFYSALVNEDGKIVSDFSSKQIYHSLFYHRMGTLQKEDVLVASYQNEKNMFVNGVVSGDGRYLFVYYFSGIGRSKNMIYYYPLESIKKDQIKGKLNLKNLFTNFDAYYQVVYSDKTYIDVLTTKYTSTGHVIRVKFSEVGKGPSKWKKIIKSHPSMVLQYVKPVGEKYYIAKYLNLFTNVFYIYERNTGKYITELSIEKGRASFVFSSIKTNKFFIKISSLKIPQIIYTGDLSELKNNNQNVTLNIFGHVKIKGITESSFVTEKLMYTSKDGTEVPMLIYYRKGISLNGKNPLILEAFGSYGAGTLPEYNPAVLLFSNHFRGIYAVAAVRGSGDYGEDWHEQGKLHNKHNTFEDFISATEFLIRSNYTRPSKLAIHGVKEGGLLTTVVSRRRPELYGSVVTQIAPLDLLNNDSYTNSPSWRSEFGDLSKRSDFENLLSYSPLHNLQMPNRPIQWPCTLLTGELVNNKVFTTHTLKYVAELYNTLKSGIKHQRNPVFVRISKDRGFHKYVDAEQKVEELVDIFAFIKETLNIKWRY